MPIRIPEDKNEDRPLKNANEVDSARIGRMIEQRLK